MSPTTDASVAALTLASESEGCSECSSEGSSGSGSEGTGDERDGPAVRAKQMACHARRTLKEAADVAFEDWLVSAARGTEQPALC